MPKKACEYCDLATKPVHIFTAGRLVTSFTRSLTDHRNLFIVPNRHVERFADLSAGETVDMIEEAQDFIKRLGKASLGFDITISDHPQPDSAANLQHVCMSVAID